MYFSSQTLHIFYKQITFFLLANLIIEMISTPKKYKRMVEMDILSIIALLGGLAFFLFGMNIMGEGLEKVGGGKLEKTLENHGFSVTPHMTPQKIQKSYFKNRQDGQYAFENIHFILAAKGESI